MPKHCLATLHTIAVNRWCRKRFSAKVSCKKRGHYKVELIVKMSTKNIKDLPSIPKPLQAHCFYVLSCFLNFSSISIISRLKHVFLPWVIYRHPSLEIKSSCFCPSCQTFEWWQWNPCTLVHRNNNGLLELPVHRKLAPESRSSGILEILDWYVLADAGVVGHVVLVLLPFLCHLVPRDQSKMDLENWPINRQESNGISSQMKRRSPSQRSKWQAKCRPWSQALQLPANLPPLSQIHGDWEDRWH